MVVAAQEQRTTPVTAKAMIVCIPPFSSFIIPDSDASVFVVCASMVHAQVLHEV